MAEAAIVRADILADYSELFGAKSIGGRTVDVQTLIAAMTRATRDECRRLLRARHELQARVAQGTASFDWLDAETMVTDPDGRRASVAAIRQGMLDRFFGRSTAEAWRIAPSQPIPAEVTRPGLEGTGPAIDLGMAIGALNSGAASWMWDWEDAAGDYRAQLYQAWRNLKQILNGDWDHRPYLHPTKTQTDDQGRVGPRHYAIAVERGQWPTIFHRVPGLHLRNRQITVDGEETPGMIPALVIHALNNYESQLRNGSGIYFYVPKLESWEEARLVGVLLRMLEQAISAPPGSLKIKVLNERAEFALQQEAIQWVLRENLIGPNVGRWDYLNSRQDMFHHDPGMVFPDPASVTMTEPSMTYYTRRNALLALLAGGTPIGGMAAQMQNPRRPELDGKALRDIWFDKLRERLTGLFLFRGTLYDTYRQSWVATVTREYVEAGREPLVAAFEDLQRIVDSVNPDERARLEALGLIKDGRMAPMELGESELTLDHLWSDRARTQLLARPEGPTTEDGLRYAMYMATEFMYQQLRGNNAAAIDDPKTGLRFMNDLATYEIFWHFLYLTVYHGARLTADGRYTKAGQPVTPELFLHLLDERRETVKQLFDSRKQDYDSSDVELVLQILQRHVVDRTSATLVPQPRWVKYGSRVLLSVIEENHRDREVILDAIFQKSREELLIAAEAQSDRAPRELAWRALRAHDYVFDVFAPAGEPVASATRHVAPYDRQ
jgi:malate synthase